MYEIVYYRDNLTLTNRVLLCAPLLVLAWGLGVSLLSLVSVGVSLVMVSTLWSALFGFPGWLSLMTFPSLLCVSLLFERLPSSDGSSLSGWSLLVVTSVAVF